MKKINIFKINCQKIKILKIKHGATRFFLIIHHQRGTIKYLQTQNHTADDILVQVI